MINFVDVEISLSNFSIGEKFFTKAPFGKDNLVGEWVVTNTPTESGYYCCHINTGIIEYMQSTMVVWKTYMTGGKRVI